MNSQTEITGKRYSKMPNNSKIFVIYHKPENPIKTEVFQPICVGSNKDQFSAEFLRDDVGENIAAKNDKFNELTAICWVFKHIEEFSNTEYFGFCHYRRLFCFDGWNKTAYVQKSINRKLIDVDNEKIDRLFNDYDFIAPRSSHYRSVKKHYQKSHNKEDLDILLNAIDKVAPEYKESAEQYFDGQDEFLYNMFVFKKEDFVNYYNFVFPVLDEFLKLKPEVQRLYVSERLTGVFITHLMRQGKTGLFLPILHVRSKSFKIANKQVKQNFKENKDRGLFYKLKPVILCFLPRGVEQYFRRRKAR